MGMKENPTLETDKELFLNKEYKFVDWIYSSFREFKSENEHDLDMCDKCQCYYWKDLEKMCEC